MKMKFPVFLLLFIFSCAVQAQQQFGTVTIPLDCWEGFATNCNGGTLPCGIAQHSGNAALSNEPGWLSTCGFYDTVPVGATVFGVNAEFFMWQCAPFFNTTGYSTVIPLINGQPIGSYIETRFSCGCTSTHLDACLDVPIVNNNYPNGLPGYKYGAANTFGISLGFGSVIALEHVDLKLAWGMPSLTIIQPTDTQMFSYSASLVSSDPVTYEARLRPQDGARKVDWTVHGEYQTSGGSGAWTNDYTYSFAPSTTRNDTYNSVGGKFTVNAQATVNQKVLTATPVTFYITGIEIPEAAVTGRLVDLYQHGATPHLMTGIASVESTYLQFRERNLYEQDGLWPNQSYDASVSHIGLMQVATTVQDAWNWETNTLDGVNLFVHDKLQAAARVMRGQKRGKRGLRDLSSVELENMALVYYGPHGDAGPYYTPVHTQNGGWDWALNSANNPQGIAYADRCRASMR